VFEEGDELARVDWRLAWDIVLIGLLHKLHEASWFNKHPDVVEQAVAVVEEQEQQSELSQ